MDDSQNTQTSAEAKAEEKAVAGPLGLVLPPDYLVWKEARRLVAEKNTRLENLSICCSQDPVIAMELLRISNAMYFAGGKSAITTIKTSIVRLGSQVVLETLDGFNDRPQFEDEDVQHWFEVYRSKGRRVSIMSRILAEAVSRNLGEDCEMSGLLTTMGDLLAVAHFKEEYVKLAEELSRSGLNYRLNQDHKFDVERMGLAYLRRLGIPEAIIFAIDREGRPRTPDRAIMKPICAAAVEMVEAFDNNRWEKLAPGKNLPPKSSLRMLQMNDAQYLKLYERASEYLFSSRLEDEKKKQQKAAEQLSAPQEVEEAPRQDGEAEKLQSEIEDILDESEDFNEPLIVTTAKAINASPREKISTQISTLDEAFVNKEEMFSLTAARATDKKKVARVVVSQQEHKPVEPPRMLTQKASKAVTAVSSVMENAKTSEELLSGILEMLVDQGPFEKSAIIVVSKDRRYALVVAARGPNIGNGQRLELDDPLSPLAKCFSKVQSFGSKENKSSPFGSKAFALAPLDADHDTPVALYADCGNEGSLTFESRRVFRTVVEILNQKLPTIPGGIPVEVA